MISMTYDQGAKRSVSLGEMNPVDFAGFPPRRGAKRKDREINGVFGDRGPDVARRRPGRSAARHDERSKMAPQAIEITQNGLGNGDPPVRGRRESIGRISYYWPRSGQELGALAHTRAA
jgi:hypothetical protein